MHFYTFHLSLPFPSLPFSPLAVTFLRFPLLSSSHAFSLPLPSFLPSFLRVLPRSFYPLPLSTFYTFFSFIPAAKSSPIHSSLHAFPLFPTLSLSVSLYTPPLSFFLASLSSHLLSCVLAGWGDEGGGVGGEAVRGGVGVPWAYIYTERKSNTINLRQM